MVGDSAGSRKEIFGGYEITRERDHVRVTGPNGVTWTEDTTGDALQEIRRLKEELS